MKNTQGRGGQRRFPRNNDDFELQLMGTHEGNGRIANHWRSTNPKPRKDENERLNHHPSFFSLLHGTVPGNLLYKSTEAKQDKPKQSKTITSLSLYPVPKLRQIPGCQAQKQHKYLLSPTTDIKQTTHTKANQSKDKQKDREIFLSTSLFQSLLLSTPTT